MIFAAVVAFSLVTGMATAHGREASDMLRKTPFNHNQITANNSSISIQHTGNRLVLDTSANQTIRGTTALDPGTKLEVQVHATKQFFMSVPVTVQPDGTFNATFNFTEYESGTEFGVVVGRSRNNSSEFEALAAVDGVLHGRSNQTAAPSTTATTATTRTSTTMASTTSPTNTSAAEHAATRTTDTETTTAATDRSESESGGQPGFGFVVALAALATLAALGFGRRIDR